MAPKAGVSLLPLLLALLGADLTVAAADVEGGGASTAAIAGQAKAASDWIVALRRKLHAIPELGGQEHKTSALIKATLEELGIPYKGGYVGGTGIVATIGSGKGPVVALRSDIDSLPIQEPEGLPFRSQHEGHMHACGHDAHTSMLLGAAKVLKQREASLPGTVRLVFQPNEEFGAGGEHIVKEGALEGVSAAFALHVWPSLESGQMATRAGTIMGGALSFHITVTGRGGHAAMPHLNVDPIVAAAAIISGLQSLVSRETSPLSSAVLSITLLRAGSAYNVIPDAAEVGGTIRVLDHDHMVGLQARLEALSASVATGFGCAANVDWRLGEQPYYPPTVNDGRLAAMASRVAAVALGGQQFVEEATPSMAGEDFSFYCRAVPCTLGFLGTRNEALGSVHALHNPRFMLDEGVLHKGAALHASWAVSFLEKAGEDGACFTDEL